MNTRVISVALALLMVVNGSVLAEDTTHFIREGEEKTEVVLYLEKDVTDANTEIEIPNSEVIDASYVVTGGPDQDGNYAEDVSVTVRGANWQYSGEGYGALGLQNEFSDSSSKKSASFSGDTGGETSIELLLPVNATINNAEVTLAGLSPAGELGEYRLASKNTDGGSHSILPSVVVDSSDTFAVWRDDGNLEDREAARYNILFNSRDGSGWDDPILIYGNEQGLVQSQPVISGDSDYLAVAWISSYNIQGIYSEDEGNSWSDVITYDSDYSIYAHDLEVESEELYLALSIYAQNDDGEYDYKIYFSKSDDDGATWTTPVEVSDSDTAKGNMYPRMDVDGSNVYISWLDGYPSTTDSSVYHASSSNGGTSFGAVSQLSGTSNTGEVDVSCVGSNVVVAWTEAGTTDDAYIVKARSSSNGGSTFSTESTVSSADDTDVFEIDSTNDGSNNFYISWTRFDSSDNYNIAVARSSNSGGTWNPAVEIDGMGDSDLRGLAYIDADSSKIVAVWTDTSAGDGASSDPDIHYSYSTNDGSSWSSLEEIGSDKYYEADSFATALAYSNNYLYTIYWDGGDNDPEGDSNGNDVNPSGSTLSYDGDIFFRRSSDDGESWGDAIVISNSDTDGRTYNPPSYASYYYSYYLSDIAASGSNVYVAWSNYDYDKAQYEIRFSSSSNSGSTWSEPTVISSEVSAEVLINSYAPAIVSNGNDVYVAWQEYRSDGTGIYYDIVHRYSSNGGSSWDSAVYVTDSIDGTQYIPEIAYGNDRVHLTWHSFNRDANGKYAIEYASSDDDGDSWELQTLYEPSGTAVYSWFPDITVDEEDVYVVWQDDDWDVNGVYDFEIILKKSEDNGGTWDDGTLIVESKRTANFFYMLPAIVSNAGIIYITYQDYRDSIYDHYFALSQDSGSTWYDDYEITDGHLINYAKMEMAIDEDGKAYFGYYDDTNIAEETDEDIDIYIRATIGGYPTNPTINLDGGGDDWEWAGEFNQDNSPITWKNNGEDGALKSFKDALEDGLEDAIDNSDTFVDEYGVEMANITLTVTSDTEGRISFTEMKIEYTVDFLVDQEKLVNNLNTLVEQTDESESTVEATFSVTSSSNGKVILKDLLIESTEAELAITQMDFSNSSPKEGSDLTITVHVENTGQGDASATITWWYDDNEIGTRTLPGIESGSTKTVSIIWNDIPDGNFDIRASIVDSVPVDKTQGDEDTEVKSISIENAEPLITTSFSFDGIVVEGSETGWDLTLENIGDKYGNIIAYIYEEEIDEDNVVFESPLTKIDVGSIKTFDGKWTPDPDVDKFYLVIMDYSGTEQIVSGENCESIEDIPCDGEYFDINIQKMPKLTVTNLEWVDENDNSVTSFSEGTNAYAKIYIINEGSFDVTASVDLSLTSNNRKQVPSPNYGASVEFNAGSETILMINGVYPEISFNSGGGGSSLTGVWTVEVEMNNIMAKNFEEQIWDSEILAFSCEICKENEYKIEVLDPPELMMTQFTADRTDIGEGQAVMFTIVIVNDGEAEATGTVLILQSGSVVGSVNFTVPGYKDGGSVAVDYPWSVPGNYDGTVNLRAQIDAASVNPPGGPSDNPEDDYQTLTLNVEGTLEVKPLDDSGMGTGDIIVPILVFVVLITGLGGAYFMYRRSQPSGMEEDSFGDLGMMPEQAEQSPATTSPAAQPQPPPEASSQPEQTPVAPPPQETILSITVPAGAQPGQQIQIQAPDGRVLAVTVPEGMQPGSQFQVKI